MDSILWLTKYEQLKELKNTLSWRVRGLPPSLSQKRNKEKGRKRRKERIPFLTKCRKNSLEFLISVVFTKVFDVDIGELHSFGAKLYLSFFAGLKVANKSAKTVKPIN